MKTPPGTFYHQHGKHWIDLALATVGLILVSPILLLSALFLAGAQQGKVFFIQERPGLNGQIFNIYKFKTMTDETDEQGDLLPDDQRKTVAGNLIRKLSIDELLQLVNVVKGDMSLIGPRPLLVEYLDRYSSFQSRRHEVRPGITGLAQVKGRNAISWNQRFRYDVFYVDHLSFGFDLVLLCWTLKKVVSSGDVDFNVPPGTDTRFMGSDRKE